ncbi:CDP-alcohol phosphatidyltransferase family protein [Salinicola sp. LHM]|uniref:CDP-alcohol phosphatidyltransferase family protein n=1 Tax=Salinicola sp. LHM TaxID=3065298 RepID=UPI002ACDAC89|nr:CDP-alcohol phosphatidyltransferase family protein [Salinicola sp. LHM]WQH31908.1 CDP-alcohol phosphatidyltransferase family protein [Salinicola sp. LHM]
MRHSSARMRVAPPSRRFRSVRGWVELAAGLALVALLVEWVQWAFSAPSGLRFTAGGVYLAIATAVLWVWPAARHGLGWANRITLLRAALIAVIAGVVVYPDFIQRHAEGIASLCLLALSLDGIDGWVARRTGSSSAFGARFDMELDAFFIVVLCTALIALEKVGPWVLVIGLARYAFVIAGMYSPWLNRALPESYFRKTICVWQVATLMVCLLPFVEPVWVTDFALLAAALLLLSFGRDIIWLWRHRPVDDAEF